VQVSQKTSLCDFHHNGITFHVDRNSDEKNRNLLNQGRFRLEYKITENQYYSLHVNNLQPLSKISFFEPVLTVCCNFQNFCFRGK
jgi:hypothetical protein